MSMKCLVEIMPVGPVCLLFCLFQAHTEWCVCQSHLHRQKCIAVCVSHICAGRSVSHHQKALNRERPRQLRRLLWIPHPALCPTASPSWALKKMTKPCDVGKTGQSHMPRVFRHLCEVTSAGFCQQTPVTSHRGLETCSHIRSLQNVCLL